MRRIGASQWKRTQGLSGSRESSYQRESDRIDDAAFRERRPGGPLGYWLPNRMPLLGIQYFTATKGATFLPIFLRSVESIDNGNKKLGLAVCRALGEHTGCTYMVWLLRSINGTSLKIGYDRPYVVPDIKTPYVGIGYQGPFVGDDPGALLDAAIA